MPERLVIPPIRTPLADRAGESGRIAASGPATDQTAKEWYLYWRQHGDQTNANTIKLEGLLTQGAHGERPPAAGIPEGAVYIETDRGAVYQNRDGAWHYVAGTMWGTLSPDQRPTDLGVNDAGFQFRSTDTNPAYAPREFLWSQSAWVEVTLNLYGAHAARPAANALTPPRTFYTETDRTVLYQQIDNTWHYVAGTMWGTLSPDQRPTDLGVLDAGFTFRGTDQQREFIWSGTAWIEVTPPLNNLLLVATGTIGTGLTLTTSAQPVPGCSLTLSRAGTYLVFGVFDFMENADNQQILIGGLSASGASFAAFQTNATGV